MSDGFKEWKTATSPSGEPIINSMKPGADPNFVPAFRQPRKPLEAYEIWQLSKERRRLRQEYFDNWFATAAVTGTGRPVDALIAPVFPHTAVPHGSSG